MLVKCEEYYRGNLSELKNIQRFRRTYDAKDAIAWYTDECFLYRLLNRALRTEDIDGLYLFRFYIIDLCKQLEEESRKNVGTMTLYRGQVISEQELDRIKHSVGSLISTNGFFSTTLVKIVAINFLQQAKRHDLQQILFEIKADSSLKSVVFADVEELSRIKGEHEVLFGIGAVFKIECVDFSKEMKCWLVQMAATDEGMENLQGYTDATKKQYEDTEIAIIFGRLLTEMNELAKAMKYFNLLLIKAEKDSLTEADVLNEMGFIFYCRHERSSALEHYTRAYEIRKTRLHSNHPKIAHSFMNIVDVYDLARNYKKVLEYNKRALDIYRVNYGEGDHIAIAKTLSNLGKAYYGQKRDFDSALDCFTQTLEMRRRLLPQEHADIAHALWDIGYLYYVYKGKDDYESAFDLCDKKLTELRKEFGEVHPTIGQLLYQLADICQKRNDSDEAMFHFEKAMSVFEKCVPPEQEQIGNCLFEIGHIHEKNENFQLALKYFSKQLDVVRKICLPDDLAIGYCLGNIGETYLKLKSYNNAMEYLEEALKIFRLKYADDHEDVQWVLENIDEVKKVHGSNSHPKN
ncbi:unnamed protein product [Rotaria sordida]|uniref:ADP ribosyltransferase domain-containing protein n=1 Tax=Rotaria sordida TaxID=392033 RepID=A0A816DWH8_9BILA|nr:unnamed protein product [Rotaria sordida]CAF1639198.1 unnamed protein product [Rotaria sordida]